MRPLSTAEVAYRVLSRVVTVAPEGRRAFSQAERDATPGLRSVAYARAFFTRNKHTLVFYLRTAPPAQAKVSSQLPPPPPHQP